MLLLLSSLDAAVLTGSNIDGMQKFCYYSDGTVFTVGASDVCPATI